MAKFVSDAHKVIVGELSRFMKTKVDNKMRVSIPCPFHKETMPSLYINLDPKNRRAPIGGYFCFSGATRLLTDSGTKRIDQLAGGTHNVLTTGGTWTAAPFKSYGVQPLMRIDLTRNGVKKVIYATKEHRWFLKEYKGKCKELTTEDLQPGQSLATQTVNPVKTRTLDIEGIRHGFILGDGTIDKRKRHTKAYLYAEKSVFMQPYFNGCTKKKGYRTYKYDYKGSESKYQDRITVVTGFPLDYKKLPSIDSPAPYLLGFLAGLIAADGCVDKDGTTSLHSTDKKLLRRIRDIATKVGITTLSLTCQMRKGYGLIDTPIYRIHFLRTSLPTKLLLNPTHRKRFVANPPKLNYLCWKVVRVRPTKRVETVYCCEVPKTHAFVLEDNILTGNCFGCKASTAKNGGWNGLAKMLGLAEIDGSMSQVTTFVARQVDKKVFDPQAGWELDDLLEEWDCGFATAWPRDVGWRGLPGWLVNAVGGMLAFDERQDQQVCLLPQYNDRVLVGAVKAVCRVKKTTRVKYLSSPGTWVKTDALMFFHIVKLMLAERTDRSIFLVEGSRDALRLIGCGFPALAILGTNNWSEEKRDLLMTLDPDRVFLAFDNDNAGREATKLVLPTLKGYTNTTVIKWENDKDDPGAVDIEQIRKWRKQYKIETTLLNTWPTYKPQ